MLSTKFTRKSPTERTKRAEKGNTAQSKDITVDVAATAKTTKANVVVATKNVCVENVSSQAATDSETKRCCNHYPDWCNP